jgi:hypothetical protein
MDHQIIVGEGPADSVSIVGPEGAVRDLVMKSLLTLRDVQITTGHDPAVAYVRSDAFGADYLESLVSIAAMRIAFDSPSERPRSCETDRDRGHRRRAEARAAERASDLGRGGDLRREAERRRCDRRDCDDTERRRDRDDTERRSRDDTERSRGHTERSRGHTERRGRSADRGRSGKMHDKGRGRPRSLDSDRPDKKRRM